MSEYESMAAQKQAILARSPDAKLRAAAQRFVDLFVWQEREADGEVAPHLDRHIPDFNDTLTELRDALRIASADGETLQSGEPGK